MADEEEVSDKVLELVNNSSEKLLEYVEGTEKFAAEQGPLLLEEILTFHLTFSLFMMAVSGIIVWVTARHLYNLYYMSEDEIIDNSSHCNQYETRYVITGIASGIASFFFTFSFLFRAKTVLMIWLAPRLYILEYLKDFV